MTVANTIGSATSHDRDRAVEAKTANTLDINDFLTLMTAQLNNQDPLKPLDSTAFVAQLAQFGTVSGIQSMQNSLATLSDSLRSSQALSGATLVGHHILAPASTATYSQRHDPHRRRAAARRHERRRRQRSTTPADRLVRHIWRCRRAPACRNSAGTAAATTARQLASGSYSFQVIANVGGSNVSLQPLLSRHRRQRDARPRRHRSHPQHPRAGRQWRSAPCAQII